MKYMKMVCARCGKEKVVTDAVDNGKKVSQGICRECLARMRSVHPKSVREILEDLPAPVLLLDREFRIQGGNRRAGKFLNRPLAEIENFLPGEALECVNARLPGGCGKTIHCQACALRQAISQTIATGEGVENIPAFQDVFQKDGSILRRFYYITTEMMEELVLLQIDEVVTLETMEMARRFSTDVTV